MLNISRKIDEEPAQQELAALLIGVVEGRANVMIIPEFIRAEGWTRLEGADRLRHSLSMIKASRAELYRTARQICMKIYQTM